MKKLIAIAVVFALVAAGSVFAVDLGGEVIGTVNLMKGDNQDGTKVTGSADMNRIRIQGEGEVGDGKFFGWFRAEGPVAGASFGTDDDGNQTFDGGGGGFWGHAGWKPIDQLKIWIGSNGGDGFFAKEGNTAWMFYQRATDVGVTMQGDNVWGWGLYGVVGLHVRDAFYGGGYDGNNALYLTISPVSMVNINFELPFFNGGEIGDIFKALVAQVDLNFDFGNIAITYEGDPAGPGNGKGPTVQHWNATDGTGKIYGYFGLNSIDKLSLDFGLGFKLPDNGFMFPLAIGVGAKVDITDAFGLKARVVTSFAGDDDTFSLLGDVLPYFAVNDNLKILASLGLGMGKVKDGDGASIGFHVNPYVWIGQEWGPSFWAGFKLWGEKKAGADEAAINWAIPIAIGVSF